MSDPTPTPDIVYLAQGKIRLKPASASSRTLDSAYGNSIREKEVRSQQKHSWKSNGGGGSPFGGNALWGKSAMAQDVPLAITSICGGKEKGSLIYSLESGSLCALLEAADLGADEKRLWNDNRTRIRHLAVSSQNGDMAFGVMHENGTANIGLKFFGESGIKEITEGDSFDTAPYWVPGDVKKIVFQTAGIGRNREGQFLALGPFSIQQVEIEAVEMSTLLESQEFDYLAPKSLADGSLLYIQRPYTRHERPPLLRVIKDIVLFPPRLLFAIYQFLNFFSAIFTGKRLSSSDSAKSRQMDMRQMMIWGNLVNGQTKHKAEEEGLDLVPKTWQLCQRDPKGNTKILASGVLAFDVKADGAIVYTNGNAIFILHPDGRKERLLNERMIEQVFFVPA